MPGETLSSIISKTWSEYKLRTASRLKLLDAYLVYVLLTGIIQFIYCVLVGTFPFNSFLSGFISCVGSFVLAACLRVQVNEENKAEFNVTPERAFADFLFAHVILHLVILNYHVKRAHIVPDMPVIVGRQFPVPTFQTYVAFCLAVLSSCVFYAFYKCRRIADDVESSEQNVPNYAEKTGFDNESNSTAGLIAAITEKPASSKNKYKENQLICSILSSDGWAVFLVINFAYCLMFMAGKLIQHVVFGNLRAVERQHLRERFWNFVFYKFVFLFGILNVQAMFTFICWLGWFTVLGLAHIGLQLCFDRFEFVSNNPTSPRSIYIKLIGLVTAIFCVAVILIGASFWAYMTVLAGFNLLAFMLAESLMLFIRIAYVVIRIIIHFKDSTSSNLVRWEDKDIVVYYVNLTADLLLYAIDLGNHIHMLLWGNAFLSVTSLIIFLQIRQLYNEFTHRLRRHFAWIQVVRSIDRCLVSVSQSCIDPSEQVCSICWETMTSAKRLPCNHLFHATCLRSWLDYDMTCPVCRLSLHKFLIPSQNSSHNASVNNSNSQNSARSNADNADGSGALEQNADAEPSNPSPIAPANPENRIVRRRFTINASRYISWIPNLSVEFSTRSSQPGQAAAAANSPVAAATIHSMQLETMAAQVRAVLPQVPLSAIISDLQMNGGAPEQTINNILEGRLGPFTGMVTGMHHGSFSLSDDESADDSSSSTSDEVDMDVEEPEHLEFRHSESQNDPLGLLLLSNQQSEVSSDIQESVGGNPSSSYPSTSASLVPTIGSRFSKDPNERHRLLAVRKRQLLSIAKQRFISNVQKEP